MAKARDLWLVFPKDSPALSFETTVFLYEPQSEELRSMVTHFKEVTDEKPGDVVEVEKILEMVSQEYVLSLDTRVAVDKALAAIRKGKSE